VADKEAGGGLDFQLFSLPIRVIPQKLSTCLLSGLVKEAAAPGTNFHPIAKTNYKQSANQNISCSNHIVTFITMNLNRLASSNNKKKKIQNSMVNGASVVPTSRK
jgi:hypothetical protein